MFELFTFLTFETLTVTNPILVYLRCKNKLLFLLRSFEVSLENCIFSCNVIWQVLKWILFLKSFLLFQFRLVRAKKNKYCQRAFLVLLIFCSSKGSVNRKIVLTRKKIIYILIFSKKGVLRAEPKTTCFTTSFSQTHRQQSHPQIIFD